LNRRTKHFQSIKPSVQSVKLQRPNVDEVIIECYNLTAMFANPIKIKIKAYSWIAGSLGLSEQGAAILDKTLEKGTTLQELFTALAAQHPRFTEKVYNPETGHLDPRLIVILNKKIIRSDDLSQSALQEGDIISLTPIIAGG
jgi:molybdopterin converting factor small subunit